MAVVVALAMAAVFGAMSLANPAQAQNGPAAIEELKVTEVTETTIIVTWKFIENHDNDEYQARWAESADGTSGGWTGGGGTGFIVDVRTEEMGSTATFSALDTGVAYDIDIRTNNAGAGVGPTETAMGTTKLDPVFTFGDATPDEDTTNPQLVAEPGRGRAALSWVADSGAAPANISGWQYRHCDDTACADGGEDDADGEWTDIPNSSMTTRSYTVRGLEEDTYYFEVRPVNGLNFGTATTPRMMAEVTATLPPLTTPRLSVTEGDKEITVEWARVGGAKGYWYVVSYVDADDTTVEFPEVVALATDFSVTIGGLINDQEYTITVTATGDDTSRSDSAVATITATPVSRVIVDADPMFTPSSTDPGDSANYTVVFQIDENVIVNTRQNDLIIEFHEDYAIPSSIRNTSVAITTEGDSYPTASRGTTGTRTFTPEDVTVDGEKVLISLGDMDEQDDRFDYEVGDGEVVTVYFRQSAGITNPTEFGGYNLVGVTFGDVEVEYDEDVDPATPAGFETNIVRKIGLSDGDGGLGDVITATGKGFKNGTTLTVYRDLVDTVVMWDDNGDEALAEDDDTITPTPRVPLLVAMKDDYDSDYGNVPWLPGEDVTNDDGELMAPNGELDPGEDELCVAAKISSDDVGRCEFTVTHPTFSGGLNYINAVDGRDGYDLSPADFLLKASITASPAGGSPGETIVIQVVDFPASMTIDLVQIARRTVTGWSAAADATGADNFQIIIPNWVKGGSQELRVSTNIGTAAAPDWVRASTNIDLLGPQINVTPGTVLANQRISLVGTGFSPSAIIANDDDPFEVAPPEVSIGGKPIHPTRINDGDPVRVDNGGNWSASVDLPLAEATTADGERALRVSDSRGRSGTVVVNIPTREVTVTPDSGRVGTIAVVRGTGFPSKNDEGSSFNVEIVYDASNGNTTTVSATPDSSGRFETQLRVPTTSAIPSSNSVKVSFRDADGVLVVTTVAHEVPEGIVTPSETSGSPGSTITVSGEGFKSFVPISLVKVGTLDVTPAPKPSTDGNGMMSFEIIIPGLDVGIQTIEVHVGRTTSSTGFTVTASGVSAGDIKPSAEAVEDMGDNFVRAFNFNNDTKTWTFYDPAAGDASTLQNFITGESYWILIKATQEVILNRETRNLTCVDGNCWNQIVW